MTQSAALLTRIVASSICVSMQAGKIIRDVFSKGGLNIIEKGKNDPQTNADRSAQRCIIASLSYQFPNITIIGEEGLASNAIDEVPPEWIVTEADQDVLQLKLPTYLEDINPKDICIWVDPLDGTKEFTQGLVEHVTVLIGVAIGEKAIGGVIHQPYYKNKENDAYGRTLWGINGISFGGFIPKSPPEGKRIITTTRSHSNNIVQKAIKSLNPDEVIYVGGAGHKVILLLEGKAHAYLYASDGCKRWDTCAPEAILYAIGGSLTDIHGKRYSYNSTTIRKNARGILAIAPGQSLEWYLNCIPDDIKQMLQ